jgi:hypothetical protein
MYRLKDGKHPSQTEWAKEHGLFQPGKKTSATQKSMPPFHTTRDTESKNENVANTPTSNLSNVVADELGSQRSTASPPNSPGIQTTEPSNIDESDSEAESLFVRSHARTSVPDPITTETMQHLSADFDSIRGAVATTPGDTTSEIVTGVETAQTAVTSNNSSGTNGGDPRASRQSTSFTMDSDALTSSLLAIHTEEQEVAVRWLCIHIFFRFSSCSLSVSANLRNFSRDKKVSKPNASEKRES